MRKVLTVAGFCLVVALASIVAQAQITIGVNISTTGPAASLGIPEKNALLLGPSVIAGQKINYVFLDDTSDPTTAVQNVIRLTQQNNADVLLGPSTSPSSLAVIDAVAKSRTPMISIASASAIVSPMDTNRRWVFKTPPQDEVEAGPLIRHMLTVGVKTVSVIAVDDAYGEAHTSGYSALAGPAGIKTISIEKFNRDDTSVLAQVLRVIRSNPDAVFIAAAGTVSVTPHRTLVERGYKGKIYQSAASANDDFLRLGGKIVNGAYVVSMPILVASQLPDGYPTKKAGVEFARAYATRYGLQAPSFAGNVWDALMLVQAAVPGALKKAKPGTPEFREALRTEIENTKGFRGAGAVYTMSPTDHCGVDKYGSLMMRIVNGTWKLEQYPEFK